MNEDGNALVVARTGEFLVPEASALAMIESCAMQIQQASTIPAVKMVITQAEAIAAVMRKIKASEHAKHAALVLMVEAEKQLGRITRGIPQGKRGAGAFPGQQTKRKTLKEHGIHHFRASVAEKLASAPDEAVRSAIGASKSNTVQGVTVALGFRQGFKPEVPRSVMRTVAMNAIGLLVQCQSQKRPPIGEEVDPMREAFMRAENADWTPLP